MDDDQLTKLAEEELLKEAQRAADRANVMGPEGWRKCPSRNVNKRFLVSTLRDAVYTNKRVKQNNKTVYYCDTDKLNAEKEVLEKTPKKKEVQKSNDKSDHEIQKKTIK